MADHEDADQEDADDQEADRGGPRDATRSYPGLRLINTAYTPLLDEAGVPVSRIQPFRPVVQPCRLCPARCCRMRVVVSLWDAVRYASRLNIPLLAGITVGSSTHQTRGFRVARDARFAELNEYWSGPAELRLRSSEAGVCLGVVRLNGYERCGVYDARPSACRTYPLSWMTDTRQGGVELIRCPLPYGVTVSEGSQILQDIREGLDGWALHETIVEAWHGHAGDTLPSIEAFLEFAVPRVAGPMGIDAAPLLEHRAPEARLRDAMVDARVVPDRSRR
ncbi:MAG: YkgJ family cysteine cluster protein [Deltaproteobacteria bacterium]|nr:YkgJ family cysteine cluster protein [Deltaproteobacteria bacterium]